MDTKLDELKAKAEEMLKACRDENRKQETYEAVKQNSPVFWEM